MGAFDFARVLVWKALTVWCRGQVGRYFTGGHDMGLPFIVARAKEGDKGIKAFFNVCQHVSAPFGSQFAL